MAQSCFILLVVVDAVYNYLDTMIFKDSEHYQWFLHWYLTGLHFSFLQQQPVPCNCVYHCQVEFALGIFMELSQKTPVNSVVTRSGEWNSGTQNTFFG
jgi:hypothetical protein